jgi:hypothetical protein
MQAEHSHRGHLAHHVTVVHVTVVHNTVVNVPQQGGGWQQTAIAVGSLVGAVGFLAAAVGTFLAWRGLRENAKGRDAQLAVDFGKRWDSRRMADVRIMVWGYTPGHLRAFYQAKAESYDRTYAKVEAFGNFF